jgi:hypothetical protein
MKKDVPLYARIPQSVDEALAHGDDNDFAIAMSNLLFAREQVVGYEGLTPAERVVFSLDSLEKEVNNGGFEQYFLNTSGDHCLDAPAALRSLGAPHTSGLVERAIAAFPAGGPARNQEARELQIEALSSEQRELLASLDEDFMQYVEPLAALERKYVQEQKAGFMSPPNAGTSLMDSSAGTGKPWWKLW